MESFMKRRNILSLTAAAVSLAGLAETGRAFLNHEIGSLALLVTAQACLLSLVFLPGILSEMRDRQTLSVYRAMYIGK